MQLKLYFQPRTRAQRVRWILEELELDYDLQHIDLFKGEGETPQYLAVHPLGQLPALEVDGRIMIESGAILHWLAEAFPGHGLAPPVDSPLRRDFDQWMYFAATSLEAPAWEIVLHGQILPDTIAVKEIIPFARDRLRQALDVLEHQLLNTEYLVGDRFSAADIMTGYLLMWFPDELESRPSLQAYVARLETRPAYIRSLET